MNLRQWPWPMHVIAPLSVLAHIEFYIIHPTNSLWMFRPCGPCKVDLNMPWSHLDQLTGALESR